MTSQPPPPPTQPQPPPSSTGEQPETDHINRLPDELLLLICTKINNAKSLCICNLISKRFSTVVRQTPSLFLTFPHRNPNNRDENLPKKLFNYLSQSFFRKPPPNNFDGALFQSAIDSLKGFQNVRDLRIELPSFQHDESIRNWHAEFGRGANVCVILFATSLRDLRHQSPTSNHQIQIQNPDHASLTNHLLQSRIASSNQCFREATWRQHVLRHVVENHRRTLETAEICDSEQKGKVVVNNKHQVNDLLDPEVKLPASGYGKLWHVQVLRLPESRCVLYGATVVAIRRTDESEEECEDVGVKHLMKKRCEVDEHGLLWEVLRHILENHAPARSLNINAGRR
ncbi:putative F-box domain-containing protein [Helianthus anomalus]